MFIFEDFFKTLVIVNVLSTGNRHVETCLCLPFLCGVIVCVILLKPHVCPDKFVLFFLRFEVKEHNGF